MDKRIMIQNNIGKKLSQSNHTDTYVNQQYLFIQSWLPFSVCVDFYLHLIWLHYWLLILTYCVLSVHKYYLFELTTLQPEIDSTDYFSILTCWSIQACHRSIETRYRSTRTGLEQTCPSNIFTNPYYLTYFIILLLHLLM